MGWRHLDKQIASFHSRLVTEVKLTEKMAMTLATTIEADAQSLSSDKKDIIRHSSPIPYNKRLEELQSFQGWMSRAFPISDDPYIVRAQVIYQNYICFVYLPEASFYVLSKVCPTGTATKKCASFLISNPIRAFRNAIAHANWMYRDDFKAIMYWAKKGDNPEEQMVKFEVEQSDLSFWQALSRCVAYVFFSTI